MVSNRVSSWLSPCCSVVVEVVDVIGDPAEDVACGWCRYRSGNGPSFSSDSGAARTWALGDAAMMYVWPS